jgi:hypothetical protein
VDEFQAAQKQVSKPGLRGWWEYVVPQLDDDQRQSLASAASNRTISHRAVATVLTRWGHPVTEQQVGHWRRNHVER